MKKYFIKIKDFSKKYTGELLIVIGSGILTYNILNFSSSQNYNLFLNDNYSPGISYYYDISQIVLMALAVMMVLTGYFILKNKKI